MFPVSDLGVVLLPSGSNDRKSEQIAFYDEHKEWEHEVARPWDRPRYHGWQLEEKSRVAVGPIEAILREPASILVVCGGSGLDAELLSRYEGKVITTDISSGATKRAQERAGIRRARYVGVVADVERLPFQDRSVDVVYVHDGLHHVPDPDAAVREMLRVARRATVISEPTPSLATELAIRLRVSWRVEEAGNVVKRVSLDDLRVIAIGAGFEVVRARKYGMFYRDGTGLATRVSSAPILFPIAQVLTRAAMWFSAPIGNKLAFVAVRRDAE